MKLTKLLQENKKKKFFLRKRCVWILLISSDFSKMKLLYVETTSFKLNKNTILIRSECSHEILSIMVIVIFAERSRIKKKKNFKKLLRTSLCLSCRYTRYLNYKMRINAILCKKKKTNIFSSLVIRALVTTWSPCPILLNYCWYSIKKNTCTMFQSFHVTQKVLAKP